MFATNKNQNLTAHETREYIMILEKQKLKSTKPDLVQALIDKKKREAEEKYWNEFLAQ